MQIRKIVSKVGIEPTPLSFQGSVLAIRLFRLPGALNLPTPTCLCSVSHGISLHLTAIAFYVEAITKAIQLTYDSVGPWGLYSAASTGKYHS